MGMISLTNTMIEDLNNLERIDGSLLLNYTKNLKSFGKLKEVNGNLHIQYSNILNIMTLEQIKQQIKIRGFVVV